MMKLYWGKMSPFARKVTMTAHEAGCLDDIELVPVTVSMAEANPEVQRDNPLSKVPTLVLADGTPLYDSRTICEYLADLGQCQTMFPAGEQRWDAQCRQSLGDGVMDTLILWRQERLKPEARQTPAWLLTFSAKIAASLAKLEHDAARLQSLPFDIGHAAIGCALTYIDLRFDDIDWRQGAPQLARWHAEFEARPSALATHPDNLP